MEVWAATNLVASRAAAAKILEMQRQGPAAVEATTSEASLDSDSLAAGLRGMGNPAVVGATVEDRGAEELPILVGRMAD